jgi:UDP-N-acetylglucosamine--N-acetylmuramyl-(pentapeptide) pyrophosphoryl-undecaprenol N-acetylglucosamine transferase
MYGIPYILQEQNSFPGLTTRFFSRSAAQVHNGFPEAAEYLNPGPRTQIFDSGNPIEPPPDPLPDKQHGRSAWNFPGGTARVMLIYGGSQGSKAINDTVAAWVTQGIPESLNVIWATGQGTHAQYANLESDRVRVRAYLSPVSEAYAVTDFALSRGGAIATAELCAWGIPPIVVPLPTAAADHQRANAKALAAAGAAEMIEQRDLTVESLDRAVRALLADPGLLHDRSVAVRRRGRPHAAEEIARHALEVVNKQSS